MKLKDFIEIDMPKWSNHFELQKIKTKELPPSMQQHSQKTLIEYLARLCANLLPSLLQ